MWKVFNGFGMIVAMTDDLFIAQSFAEYIGGRIELSI